MLMNRNVSTFIGCEAEYDESSIVVFGAPFDSTTSFRPGTRFASQVMRGESWGLESYSPYQDLDLYDFNIFDGGEIELPFGNSEGALALIEDFSTKVVEDGKIPAMIGGEHLVTLGAFKGVFKKYPAVHVIHFDAHADLREDYLGQKLSHATVIHRVWDLVGDNKIFQFGIRSGEKEEFLWAKDHVYTNKFNCDTLDYALERVKGKPVYVTIDLDVLDPSVFPGTGTPEPGGIQFNELLNSILKLRGLNIIGFDINELSPQYDPTGASTAVACKVLREMLLVANNK
ncbi:TPA: agmatinase [Clostridium perfringens]|uniref:agmatinase n=1 Tax=Clostridium perfringens TaxID=1502 RepID=UPI001A33C71C|nr:agmatinase [Clostridium perfringens]EJT6151495.1 agmatinase [Clostridium perfringens]EJT6157179.1 agmatinase [Clostridium perfringens]MDG6877284.1 Agmatinase [Clostridium perfringens]MDG6887356.1 Agmatinase [Clostridium perfringens]MDH5078811.1 Agmatinase [Clostridium perfringens]